MVQKKKKKPLNYYVETYCKNFPLCDGNRLPVKTLNYYVENYSKIFFVSSNKKKSALDFFLDSTKMTVFDNKQTSDHLQQ